MLVVLNILSWFSNIKKYLTLKRDSFSVKNKITNMPMKNYKNILAFQNRNVR